MKKKEITLWDILKKFVNALEEYRKDKKEVEEINSKIADVVMDIEENKRLLKKYIDYDMNGIMKEIAISNVKLLSEKYYEYKTLIQRKKEIEEKYMKVQ